MWHLRREVAQGAAHLRAGQGHAQVRVGGKGQPWHAVDARIGVAFDRAQTRREERRLNAPQCQLVEQAAEHRDDAVCARQKGLAEERYAHVPAPEMQTAGRSPLSTCIYCSVRPVVRRG